MEKTFESAMARLEEIAAALEGRKFIGIEKNADGETFKTEKADYIDISAARIKETIPHLDFKVIRED